MYVCICNSINEKDLEEAAKVYQSDLEFFAASNFSYKCGYCRKAIATSFSSFQIKKDSNGYRD
jgi:bacterioferritin-associated ferredoxin